MGRDAPGGHAADPGGDDVSAAEHPRAVLERWAEAGAVWRVATLTPERAEIDLCSCTGEPVDRLATTDPDLIAELRERPSSEV
jgi:hypothetical protein